MEISLNYAIFVTQNCLILIFEEKATASIRINFAMQLFDKLNL